MKHKKIAFAVSLEEELITVLNKVNNTLDIGQNTEIHLVHVVPTILYARGMHPSVLTYPLPEERPKIEQAITEKLRNIAGRMFPGNKNVVLKCLFGQSEKEIFCDYLKEQQMELAIVATRGKHGIPALFDSSFAQYICRHSSAPVVVLR